MSGAKHMVTVSARAVASAIAAWGQRCYAAARELVEAYEADGRRGAAALAAPLGKSASTLQHELDPGYAGAKLGLLDAVRITNITGDLRILNAFAAECGAMVVPLPSAHLADDCAMTAAAQLMHECSDVIASISRAIADSTVTANELDEFRRELGEMLLRGQHVHAILQAKHLSCMPAPARIGA